MIYCEISYKSILISFKCFNILVFIFVFSILIFIIFVIVILLMSI